MPISPSPPPKTTFKSSETSEKMTGSQADKRNYRDLSTGKMILKIYSAGKIPEECFKCIVLDTVLYA